MPTIRLNGLRHYFRLEGDPGKRPLALLHPIGADHSLFDKLLPHLLDTFCVLRHDLRGHGGTETPAQDCTVEELSADLLALADELGWQRFAACGVSLGGMAAQHAAIRAPERLSHLVLCSTAAVMAPPPGGWDQRAATARRDGMAALAAGMVERMFSPRHRQLGDPQVDTLRTVFLRTDVEGYARCVAVLRDTDLRAQLHAVRAPTLVASGQDDPLITPEKVQALTGAIEGATHRAFDCGHFPPVERPAEFAAALIAHARATPGA